MLKEYFICDSSNDFQLIHGLCWKGYVSDVQKEDDTKEIRFSLNMEGGLTCNLHQELLCLWTE